LRGQVAAAGRRQKVEGCDPSGQGRPILQAAFGRAEMFLVPSYFVDCKIANRQNVKICIHFLCQTVDITDCPNLA
jgi:hypothetical protein